MRATAHFLERHLVAEWADPPEAANENFVLSEVMTPPEVLQWARREKRRLIQAVAADPKLWSCPEHRRTWSMRLAIEQIARRLLGGGHEG